MKGILFINLIWIVLIFQTNCATESQIVKADSSSHSQTVENNNSLAVKTPVSKLTPVSDNDPDERGWDELAGTDQDTLNYKGYEISKRYKKEKNEVGESFDVGYTLIKKNGKKLAEFSFETESLLTETRFGLVPLLGDENNKQLIIEASLPKSERYWIINLAPKFEVIFDSNEFNLGHDLRLIDLNKDKKAEITLDLMTFDYFGINYRKGWATTKIIFKFDEKRRKYTYANPDFAGYLLKDEPQRLDRIKQIKLNKGNREHYESDIYNSLMGCFLTSVYLGREGDAWRVFEEYDLKDKEEVRMEIKKYLAKDGLYRYIYLKKHH